jgi:protein-S-isoprenylcysteine O-methyltransferase Ste14
MNELLLTLERKPSLLGRTGLVCLFVAVTGAFLIAGHLAHVLLGCNLVVLHLAGWLVWFTWQGWLFPLNRQRYLRADAATAYRKAFPRDIQFGVSFGASQMARPAFYGLMAGCGNAHAPEQLGVGLGWILAGLVLLYLGFRTIGFAGAGFLAEYRSFAQPMIEHSVYAYIRHPLFLGGALASLGSGLLFAGPWPVALGLANVAILPVYGRIEDARLILVFGEGYRGYAASVGRFLPRLCLLRAGIGACLKKGATLLKAHMPLPVSGSFSPAAPQPGQRVCAARLGGLVR